MPTNTLRLGRPLKEYKGSAGSFAKIIIISIVCGGISALFFVGAVSEGESHEFGGMVALSIIGLLFLAVFLFGIYNLFRGRGASLSLYENGLSFRRAGKESTTTWDEIGSYMQETACRITKQDGEVIEFGLNLKGADEVAQRIHDETLKRMLPKVKAAILQGTSVQFKGLRPGEKIPFGKTLDQFAAASAGFTVNADGITANDGGERIAWKDATDFGIAEEVVASGRMGKHAVNVFFIRDANRGLRTRLGLLENAHVLLALCSEMAGEIDGPKNVEGTSSHRESIAVAPEKLFPVGMPQRLERIRRKLLIAVGVLFAVVLLLVAAMAVAAGLLWAWEAHKAAKIVKNQFGMEFVPIPAGSFPMGSENGRSDEQPVHQVTISKGFLMGRYEVTSAQWKAVMGRDSTNFKGDDFPAQFVSWNDAQEFIRRLNQKNGGYAYRLPTEAEWEYACRAGTTGDMAYYELALDKIHTVGYRQPNDWGLYDMHGNVAEWCQDWYDKDYYRQSPGTDPPGPLGGPQRVKRGGSWYDNRSTTLSSARAGGTPDELLDSNGFRVVAVALTH
jgi:formylglycine-generating enzyme required for sulfatase activity